jgi:hypothetical protein
MTCPVCNGSGRVPKRFLLFFTRQARCAHCLGTGEFPPPIVEQARYAPGFIRDDEPFDRRSPSTIAARDRGDTFEAGSGGRSGGGGGGASWGDASSDKDAPVIVDPFSAGASAVVSAAALDAGSSASGGSPSEESGSSGDSSGTSY